MTVDPKTLAARLLERLAKSEAGPKSLGPKAMAQKLLGYLAARPPLDAEVAVEALRETGELDAESEQILDLQPKVGPTIVQRWRNQHDFYRSSGEKFSGADWRVEVMLGTTGHHPLAGLPLRRGVWESGKDFIVRNHYAASYSQMRVMVGLFRAKDAVLFGVASYGNVQDFQASRYGGVGLDEILELNRFVLLDEVPHGGETWFLSRATDLARQVHALRGFDLRVLLSYSDPVPRRAAPTPTDPEGFLTMPGHVGNIYQAYAASGGTKAIYCGKSSEKTLKLDESGVEFHPRSISKIRSLDTRSPERGAVPASERFALAHGERRPGESYADWVTRIESVGAGRIRKVRHSGNHTYLWVFGDKREQREVLSNVIPPEEAYPKTPRQLYLNLQRRYERAWTRGDIALIATLAADLLNVWVQLTPADRKGLTDPPQMGVACDVRGNPNRTSGAVPLEAVMRSVVCSSR